MIIFISIFRSTRWALLHTFPNFKDERELEGVMDGGGRGESLHGWSNSFCNWIDLILREENVDG
jgi:hypothetical protein